MILLPSLSNLMGHNNLVSKWSVDYACYDVHAIRWLWFLLMRRCSEFALSLIIMLSILLLLIILFQYNWNFINVELYSLFFIIYFFNFNIIQNLVERLELHLTMNSIFLFHLTFDWLFFSRLPSSYSSKFRVLFFSLVFLLWFQGHKTKIFLAHVLSWV